MKVQVDRRSAIATLAGLGALGGSARGERLTRPLGAQLYTVRRELAEEPERVLRQIAAIGYQEVEVQDSLYPKVEPILNDLGLQVRGFRLTPAVVTGGWSLWQEMMKRFGASSDTELREQTVEEAIAPAVGKGMRYAVVSALLPGERSTLDQVKRTAERFNRAGEVCKQAGLTLCFHNHSYEFGEVEGIRLFDALNAEFDSGLVKWQIDVFWAAVGGQDPAALILANRGRVASLHLKDMAADAPRTTEMKALPPESFRPVGEGVLDFPEILRAATVTNVHDFFVEQDETQGPPLVALRQSFENLRAMEW